ncbi:RipA family octameric membrane protein [Hymenobacter actinosclerus]|uniref:Uncharacterized protein n=1 Tax=Hymenobacter actinosclerus TaxID=82805 RepID=A0A1I0J8Z3_9BACT|nr:hypothetical protein [Hymenobacter actinosclerus]SEU06437.1 hypothetical protein SAMN04487998_3727 [Hymenobacter actinosclerus]
MLCRFFSSDKAPITNEKYSFDELKLIYESTEKVVDRRLANNKQNYTICVAILVGIAIVWKWGSDNSDNFFGAILLVGIISVFAALFCFLWIDQIEDFKKLNEAKFFVINEMAKNIYFPSPSDNISVISYRPFEKEWIKLKGEDAIDFNKNVNAVVLKSSRFEFYIPIVFRIMFITIATISFLSCFFNGSATWISVLKIIHIHA